MDRESGPSLGTSDGYNQGVDCRCRYLKARLGEGLLLNSLVAVGRAQFLKAAGESCFSVLCLVGLS